MLYYLYFEKVTRGKEMNSIHSFSSDIIYLFKFMKKNRDFENNLILNKHAFVYIFFKYFKQNSNNLSITNQHIANDYSTPKENN